MTKDTLLRIRRIYGILLAIVIIIAGLCLIAACVCIYSSGDHPFSREIVAETFSKIAFPIYLCVGMIVISILMEIIFFATGMLPQDKKSTKKTNPSSKTSSEELKKTRKQSLPRLAILFVAVFCFVYGLLTGGTADVLTKAINICTECIGLG